GGLLAGADPTAAPRGGGSVEGDGGRPGRVAGERTPGRVPGLAGHRSGIMTENHAHLVEVVDRHVDEEGVGKGEVALASRQRGDVAPEVDGNGADRAELAFGDQAG